MTEQERAQASAEHYRRMRAELDRRLSLDPELRRLSGRIRDGKADFSDTAAYSEIVSHHIGIIMQENVGTITNPLGKQYVCEALLKDHYEAINDVLGEVQVSLDEKLNIHLNPVKPKFPAERVTQVAHALEDPTVPQKVIKRRAKAPVTNVAMSYHDDYIKENAKIRAKLGMKPTITRYGSGCCKWCSEVAGKYRFGEQPKDVFRRHDNCNCTIIYDTQVLRGHQTEDGRSKKWDVVEDFKGFEPTIFSQEQAEKLQENALNMLTLAGNCDIIRSIDVDDFETVIYGKGILKEVSDTIINTMKLCEKNGKFIISDISTSVVSTSSHGTPVLQIEPMENGLLKLNVNSNYLSGKTLEEVNNAFLKTDSTVVNSLVEAVVHESGHAISISGKSPQQVGELYEKLKDAGLSGVSNIALDDGAECLAELEVLRHRGISVSDELKEFYKKYMGRDY